MANLDKQLDKHFVQYTQELALPPKAEDPTKGRQKLRISKNTPRIPVEVYTHKLLGVDLSNIPGFGRDALLGFLGEVGEAVSRFHSAKAFAKWLGFTPNNKSSGGKVLSKKTLKNNGAARAVELTQYVSDGSQLDWQHEEGESADGLFSKDRRIKAITATARKVSVLVYKMLTTGVAYDPGKLVRDADQFKQQQIRLMKKKLVKFGITGADLGLFSNLEAT